MDSYIELAKLFKERNNKPQVGILIGTVLEPYPNLTISVIQLTLDKDRLIIPFLLQDDIKNIADPYLDSGDKVMLIPTTNLKWFYIIDKVGEL